MSAVALKLESTHHWVAVNSYRVRVAAFALVALPIALHVIPRSPGALFWIVFVLQFAIYPHLMQWRALRCEEPEKAELDNLIVDAVLSGAWAAGLAFPLWISVALFLATLLNHTIMRGLPGILICPAAILFGALASTTVIAFRVFTDGVRIKITAEGDDDSHTTFEIYRSDGIGRQRAGRGALEVIPGLQATSNTGGVIRHLRLSRETMTITTFPGVSDQTIVSHSIAAEPKPTAAESAEKSTPKKP